MARLSDSVAPEVNIISLGSTVRHNVFFIDDHRRYPYLLIYQYCDDGDGGDDDDVLLDRPVDFDRHLYCCDHDYQLYVIQLLKRMVGMVLDHPYDYYPSPCRGFSLVFHVPRRQENTGSVVNGLVLVLYYDLDDHEDDHEDDPYHDDLDLVLHVPRMPESTGLVVNGLVPVVDYDLDDPYHDLDLVFHVLKRRESMGLVVN